MSSNAYVSLTRSGVLDGIGAVVLAGGVAVVIAAAGRTLPGLTLLVLLGMAVIVIGVRVVPLGMVATIALVRASAESLNHIRAVDLLGFTLSPSDAINVAISVGAAWWILARMRNGWRPWSLPLFIPLVAFFAIAGLTLAYSPAPIAGFKDVMKLASAVLTMLVVVGAARHKQQLLAILVLVLVGALHPIGLGLWQFTQSIGFDFESHGGLRILSVFDHPNHYGSYLAVVLTASWGARSAFEGPARRAAEGVGMLSLICLTLTLSRGAWLVAGLVILILGWRHKKLLLGAAVAGGVLLTFMPRVLDRLANTVESTGPANSTTIRLEIWSFALPLLAAKPILGYGWGAFQSLSNGIYAHNDYLRVLIETGLVGLTAFLVLIWSLVRQAMFAARDRLDFPRAFLGLTLGFVALCMVSNNLDKLAFQWYFWTLAGVAFAWPKLFGSIEEVLSPGTVQASVPSMGVSG